MQVYNLAPTIMELILGRRSSGVSVATTIQKNLVRSLIIGSIFVISTGNLGATEPLITVSTTMPAGAMLYDVPISSICASGYAHRERAAYAPVEWTDAIKKRSCKKLGLDVASCMAQHELDHRNPIEAGGCPNCVENLWLELWPEARQKDNVENWVYKQLCMGNISLANVPGLIEKWKDIYPTIRRSHQKVR